MNYILGSQYTSIIKAPNGRVVSMSHRPLKPARSCTVSATDFTTSQPDLDPRTLSPLLSSSSHKTSCIIVSPSSPIQQHSLRNANHEKNGTAQQHIHDDEDDDIDCKFHGYSNSTLRGTRRGSSRASRVTNIYKRAQMHPKTSSNLARRSISSQTLYRPKTTLNRQKPKKVVHRCPHTDSSPPESPKLGRIPPPPPPPRYLRNTIAAHRCETDIRKTAESNATEMQLSDANEETTSEYDDDDIDEHDNDSQGSARDIQESSMHKSNQLTTCCKGAQMTEEPRKPPSMNNPLYEYGIQRKTTNQESSLTCVNPNHYHHYHHQVGNFIAPITLITTSGMAGKSPQHFFFRPPSQSYLNTSSKTQLAHTHEDHHKHECKCGVTFQPNTSADSLSLARTLSNPTIVTVPQPYREAPQLKRSNDSSQLFDGSHYSFSQTQESTNAPETMTTHAQANDHVEDISSEVDNEEAGIERDCKPFSDTTRIIVEYESESEGKQDDKNKTTSKSYLHDTNPIEVEGELICPPPPPVLYGTLRYPQYLKTGDNIASNDPEKTTTPSSMVESSCGANSNSSSSSIRQAYQGDGNKQYPIPEALENIQKGKSVTNVVYNHVFKPKFSTPTTSCSGWNGDVFLHESPRASPSSSSSSYMPPNTHKSNDGENMDSGL